MIEINDLDDPNAEPVEIRSDLLSLVAACWDAPLDELPWGLLADCLDEADRYWLARIVREHIIPHIQTGLPVLPWAGSERPWAYQVLEYLIKVPVLLDPNDEWTP